ncbi:MAG: glycosyltransferase family 4 protein [Magnetococcus sp. WYHC-3]
MEQSPGTLLVVIENFLPRSEVFVLVQAEALRQCGWKVVFACCALTAAAPEAAASFPCHRVDCPRRALPRTLPERAWRALETGLSGNPHLPSRAGRQAWSRMLEALAPTRVLVHFASQAGMLLPVLRHGGIPWWVHFHGYDINVLGRHWGHRRLLAQVLRHSRGCLCPSEFLRRRVQSLVPGADASRLHRITPGVDGRFVAAESSATEAGSAPSGLEFISVGRLVPVKGHHVTLEALTRLTQPWRWTVVGDGPERPALEALARERGVAQRVRFMGVLDHAALCKEMARADVFVQSSLPAPDGSEEALGLSPLEASAMGLPIVVSDSGGLAETCRPGETGLVCPAGSVPALTAALEAMVRDPRQRQSLGAAGRAWVRQEWSASVQALRLDALLRG